MFTFHSSAWSVILNAFFIWIRWRTNLPIFLWGFTSFLRIPSIFWNAILVFALCTANHSSASCHRGYFPAKVCDCWGRREGEQHLLCQSCSCKYDSLFSLAQFSQVILANLSWKLRQTRNQSTRMHFLKAFNVSFSSGFFPLEKHLINTSQVQSDYVLC